jgi:hypothetical protein
MKLRYILSEDINIAKHAAQLKAVSNKTGVDEETLIDSLNTIDPSGKHTRWLLRQIKLGDFKVPETSTANDGRILYNQRAKKVIASFAANKPRLQQKDIMQYKTIHSLEEALEGITGTKSKRQGGFQVNPLSLPGVELINTIGEYSLYQVANVESLMELGEGTKWCTRRSYPEGAASAEQHIEQRSNHGFVFIISKNDGPFIQFAPDFNPELPINTGKMEYEATDVDNHLVSLIKYQKLLEPWLLQDPQAAYMYAKKVIKGRWPEAEPSIIKDASAAGSYAMDVIGDRWLEAEPKIIKDGSSYLALNYAKKSIKGRWPEAEPKIMQIPMAAIRYAKEVIGGRWPEAEPIINTHSYSKKKYQDNLESSY